MANDDDQEAGKAGPNPDGSGAGSPDTSATRSTDHDASATRPEPAVTDDTDTTGDAVHVTGGDTAHAGSVPAASPSRPDAPPPSNRQERLNWNAVAAVAGVAALLIAIATGVIGVFAYFTPRGASPTPAKLSVIGAELKPGADIQFTPEENPSDLADFQIHDNLIDVRLQNQGETPELVESIEGVVGYAENIGLCSGTGGEILHAKALYDLRVPTFEAPDVPTMPLHVEQKIPFEIKGNSYDRLAIRIGPDRVAEGGGPWLYRVDLTLHTRTSGVVTVGRFVLLTPASQVAALDMDLGAAEPDLYQCYRDAYSAIRHATADGGTIDPDLDGLRRRYAEAGGMRDGDDPDDYVSQGRDWTDYGDGLTCETGSAHGVLAEYGDITGDGVGDAAVGLYCGDLGLDSYFRKIVLVDGVLRDKRPVQLGTILSGDELRGARAQHGPSFMGTAAGHAGLLRFTLQYEDPLGSDPVFATFEFTWTGQALVPAGPVCHGDPGLLTEVDCRGFGSA